VQAALSRVGLLAARKKRFRQYSLGMKQRLAIAGALLQPRDLYVLDEPTNGLDPQGAREVRTLVRELAGDGATILISSHLLSEIEQVATHVAIMSRGRILAQGDLQGVLGNQGAYVRVATPNFRDAQQVFIDLGLDEVEAVPGTITARLGTCAADAVGPALVGAGVAFTELRLLRPALEDLFVELTGSGFDVAG
jgi:ABC-2 type transport system ATP-binding protein